MQAIRRGHAFLPLARCHQLSFFLLITMIVSFLVKECECISLNAFLPTRRDTGTNQLLPSFLLPVCSLRTQRKGCSATGLWRSSWKANLPLYRMASAAGQIRPEDCADVAPLI